MKRSGKHFKIDKPTSSSTPNTKPVSDKISSRRPIHNSSYERSLSPIRRTDNINSQSESEKEEEEEDYLPVASSKSRSLHSSNEIRSHSFKSEKRSYESLPLPVSREHKAPDSPFWIVVMFVTTIVFAVAGWSIIVTSEPEITLTIKHLQEDFPLQSRVIWNALESGINEVKLFKKPSVFLLLYEKGTEETLDNILIKIAKYATCILNDDCKLQPIILTSSNLTSEQALVDYGFIIDKYKPELERKSVMIVKNLDKVPGKIAQAFHTMCDEYTPLVGKTVFFFTIKIDDFDKLKSTDLQAIEEILKNKWSDIHDDIFYPLFTRISNMVLRIVTEEENRS